MNEREVTVYTAARYTSLLHYGVVSGEYSTKWRDTDSHFLFINYLSRKGRRQRLSSDEWPRDIWHLVENDEDEFSFIISIPSSEHENNLRNTTTDNV